MDWTPLGDELLQVTDVMPNPALVNDQKSSRRSRALGCLDPLLRKWPSGAALSEYRRGGERDTLDVWPKPGPTTAARGQTEAEQGVATVSGTRIKWTVTHSSGRCAEASCDAP